MDGTEMEMEIRMVMEIRMEMENGNGWPQSAIAHKSAIAHGSRPLLLRETGTFSAILLYTTLMIARVQ